jgi:transposase InsO family protein
VTVRTLWEWEDAAARPETRLGRPPHSATVMAQGREEVTEACAVLGHTVGRLTLEPVVALPRRVLSAALRSVKASHRAHTERRHAAHRVQRTVLATATIVGQDSTFTGHVAGQGAWSEVTRDWTTLETHALGDGHPITEASFLEHLEARAAAGTLPLVHASDNGPAYVTPAIEAWLIAHEVIHLTNRTHTPTDNSPTEHAVGEAKAEAWLGAGVGLQDAREGVVRMEAACERLNRRSRPSRGGLTSQELTQMLPSWETRVCRSVFFRACRAAIQYAARNWMSSRQRRQAEREAIFQTLERFGLMRTTRGEAACEGLKPEMIS